MDCRRGTNRAYHMHRGEYIRAGIDAVKEFYCTDRRIITREKQRSEILPVGEKEPEEGAGEEGDGQMIHVSAEALPVSIQKPQSHGDQQGIPETVGKDEPLAEGDQGVQR